MGEIVSLRRTKKAKARGAAEETAAANRARYGTRKATRQLTKARLDKHAHDLEAARLEADKSLKD
jgi:hypothetical protein